MVRNNAGRVTLQAGEGTQSPPPMSRQGSRSLGGRRASRQTYARVGEPR
jgi:hypothetical protein